MKLIKIAGAIILTISAFSSSASVNSEVVTVTEMGVDSRSTEHVYTFTGKLAGICGKDSSRYARSSEPHINKILVAAYFFETKIKVFIDESNCKITDVLHKRTY
ncbi:hypothetical protein C7M52_00671 [Mixta theicola]|nr:hypothetical protein [Mixta theicola]QHM74729.1 hypothetical protein C7M52_00671 [Mixta theicola]